MEEKGSDISANEKRMSQVVETTCKESPSGHRKGEQGVQQRTGAGPWRSWYFSQTSKGGWDFDEKG